MDIITVMILWWFSGCGNYVGNRGYSFVFRIRNTYWCYDIEDNKYQSETLIKLVIKLVDDVKLCYEFDERTNFFGKKTMNTNRDFSGKAGGILLKYCDYFYFLIVKNANHSDQVWRIFTQKSLSLSLLEECCRWNLWKWYSILQWYHIGSYGILSRKFGCVMFKSARKNKFLFLLSRAYDNKVVNRSLIVLQQMKKI